MEEINEKYMKTAIEEAKKGIGWTNPNPLVGAVITKDGRIIGRGYHAKYGELHAERNAIASCKESLKGACIYVTLEPCCHYGKTPPCTEAIIENGISTVAVGSNDPNPLAAGNGLKQLREYGINVVTGVLKEECDQLNEVFFHYIQTKTPYVVMKYAMTADGKIASYTGASKWITGEAAREEVQRTRHLYMGIMAGIGTVLADDPMLNCRIENGRNPIRIICDTKLRTPIDSRLVKTAAEIPVIIATACMDKEKRKPYEKRGVEFLTAEKTEDGLDLKQLMKQLGEKKIDSILLEGGAALNYSAVTAGIVNKVHTYLAPKLMGGAAAKTPIGGCGAKTPDQAALLENPKIKQIGEDILIVWDVKKI